MNCQVLEMRDALKEECRFVEVLTTEESGEVIGYCYGGSQPGPNAMVVGDARLMQAVFDRLSLLPTFPWMRGKLYLVELDGIECVGLSDAQRHLADVILDDLILLPNAPSRADHDAAVDAAYWAILRLCSRLGMIDGPGINSCTDAVQRFSGKAYMGYLHLVGGRKHSERTRIMAARWGKLLGVTEMVKYILLAGILVLAPVSAFAADPVVGIWKTEPDRKNLTSHIQISQCGDKFCGKVLRAFDPSGKEVMTKNIGKQIFWDVEAKGAGKYDNGTIWVPLLNVNAKGNMTLSGNTLKVSGNKGPIRDSQVWTRIK